MLNGTFPLQQYERGRQLILIHRHHRHRVNGNNLHATYNWFDVEFYNFWISLHLLVGFVLFTIRDDRIHGLSIKWMSYYCVSAKCRQWRWQLVSPCVFGSVRSRKTVCLWAYTSDWMPYHLVLCTFVSMLQLSMHADVWTSCESEATNRMKSIFERSARVRHTTIHFRFSHKFLRRNLTAESCRFDVYSLL